MNSKKISSIVLAASMAGALGMSACKPVQETPASQPSSAGSASTPSASTGASTPSGPLQSGDLLLLNDSLREKLGDAYSDAWIEDGALHVAVTTDAAAATVREAGAVAHLVTVDAAALESALQAVMAWRASLPEAQRNAIHKAIPDGRTGTVTIFVAAAQLDAVAQAAAAAKPAGDVPLIIKESTGLASPL